MKKWIRIIAVLFAAALVVLAAAGFVWSRFTYKPSSLQKELVTVQASEENDSLFFQPAERSEAAIGVIIYPGAKVEPEAYSYLGQELAERGIAAAIPKMPFHFAIFGANKAEAVIAAHPEIKKWYIGGHSLGGVAAAGFAGKNQDQISGIFFLASYPAESDNLANTDLDVLSIYGTKDGLTSLKDIEDSKAYLPDDARFAEIQGGNHAQFGLYGKQKGDNGPSLPAKEQQDVVVDELEKWIKAGSLQQ
ncbi:alpha/beta hydrolase [Bacillus mangrovi]|uniref:Alpha/beta hydrolase n=1 Tax=Metabacillus mangrovi TaxID=1491830 RepID=A0A7X2V6Q1_9BACI|nr:alpha/beta hydrolase [Metabacillus mangrovi]MTH55665.1 alpha/beta hydrolase [Metabacillus mangrovi]